MKKSLFLLILFVSLIYLLPAVWAQDNEDCVDCHEGEPVSLAEEKPEVEEGEAPEIDIERFDASLHHEIPCLKCHIDAEDEHDEGGVKQRVISCESCHTNTAETFKDGIHGKLASADDPDSPRCQFCHDPHRVLSKKDPKSDVFPLKIPHICGKCHQEGQRTALRNGSSQDHILENYSMSIHGKGLYKSGLIVSATCISCHTAHQIKKADNPESSIHPENIAETCSNCHYGIYDQLVGSIHSPTVSESDKKLPVCNDCHSSHKIKDVDYSNFKLDILIQCGSCHENLSKSYFATYHGKVSRLGMKLAAKCHDCHGAHNTLPISNSKSGLHPDNILKTCKKCHPKANRNFASYLPHATPNEKEKYPELYYSFWSMTLLLVVTFAFFGLHTLLWLIRSLAERIEKFRAEKKIGKKQEDYIYVKRFRPINSIMHLVVIISFLSLAITGMALKFSDVPFFVAVSKLLGGGEFMGSIHRFFAIVTFGYFISHLIQLINKFSKREISLRGLFKEEYSLIPLKRDLIEMGQNIRWFLWMGPKPKFGRWTYWEKFDYLAVFWGIAVIGMTGLMLWMPELFTRILPGWFINVATIIHSDEALLATGFIFVIHFFNTHFRPEKFPMDPVIFTGRMPLSVFKEERPREYMELVESDQLDTLLTEKPANWFSNTVLLGGLTFLFIGILTILAILFSLFLII